MRNAMKKSKSNLSSPQRLANRVKICKALGHPIRLGIVEMLADENELCVCVFQEKYKVDYAAISRHLLVLKNAGLVVDEKRGKNVFYRLARPCVLDMFLCIEIQQCTERN